MVNAKLATVLGAAVLAGLSGQAASAQCAASLETLQDVRYQTVGGAIDPFAAALPVEVFQLTAEAADPSACALVLAVQSFGATEAGVRTLRHASGAQMSYRLYEDASATTLVRNTQTPGAGDLIALTPRPNATPSHGIELYFGPAAPDAVSAPLVAGLYEDRLSLRLYDISGGAPVLVDEAEMGIGLEVPAVQDVRVALSEVAFDQGLTRTTLDFGELETDETAEAFVQVRSTTRYSLSLQSEQGWRLVSAEGGAVTYALSLDGTPVETGAAEAVFADIGSDTSAQGASHRLDFVIGETRTQPAGDYRDLLTIRALPVQ